MASAVTIGDIKRITAPKLADIILAKAAVGGSSSDSIAIVDVRDDDHIGGHIHGSLHFPSRSLDATMPTLLRKLEGKETVVFHCALSQQRGPGAALRYLREREAARAAAREDDGAKTKEGEEKNKNQTVYVLDRGFVGWQETYGTDERLTEKYSKELWQDGYWG